MCEGTSFYCIEANNCKAGRCGRKVIGTTTDSKNIVRQLCPFHVKMMTKYQIEDFYIGEVVQISYKDYKQMYDQNELYYTNFLSQLRNLKINLESAIDFLTLEAQKTEQGIDQTQTDLGTLNDLLSEKKKKLQRLKSRKSANENNQAVIDSLNTEIFELRSQIDIKNMEKATQFDLLNQINAQLSNCHPAIYHIRTNQADALNTGMRVLNEIGDKYGRENLSQVDFANENIPTYARETSEAKAQQADETFIKTQSKIEAEEDQPVRITSA